MKPLAGIKVINLAVNLPGPAAGRRLHNLGARVIKVEPPGGDPMRGYLPDWYVELAEGQEIVSLDLKDSTQRRRLDELLADADLLITASRPVALQRLGLGWEELQQNFPQLCQVAIVGYPAPRENEPGHDLTYQARIGLLTPPDMPRTLIADMAGAEITACEALALLLARERGQGAAYAMVALADAADYMGEPYRAGFTRPDALGGGGAPEYNLYEARDGWIAVAALEPHFKQALEQALDVTGQTPEEWRPLFANRNAAEWEAWAKEFDLPIVAVKQ